MSLKRKKKSYSNVSLTNSRIFYDCIMYKSAEPINLPKHIFEWFPQSLNLCPFFHFFNVCPSATSLFYPFSLCSPPGGAGPGVQASQTSDHEDCRLRHVWHHHHRSLCHLAAAHRRGRLRQIWIKLHFYGMILYTLYAIYII